MASTNHYLVLVRLLIQPSAKGLHLVQATAVREVPNVDQDIAVGDPLDLAVLAMGVSEHDNTHRCHFQVPGFAIMLS